MKEDRGLRETGKWSRTQEDKWMFLSSEERICQYSDLANILWNYNKRERDVRNVCLETRLKRCMSAWVRVRIEYLLKCVKYENNRGIPHWNGNITFPKYSFPFLKMSWNFQWQAKHHRLQSLFQTQTQNSLFFTFKVLAFVHICNKYNTTQNSV